MLIHNDVRIEPIISIRFKDLLKLKNFRDLINNFLFYKDIVTSYQKCNEFDGLTKSDVDKISIAENLDEKNTGVKFCKISRLRGEYLVSVYVIPKKGIKKIKFSENYKVSDEVEFKEEFIYKPIPFKKVDIGDIFVIKGSVIRADNEGIYQYLNRLESAQKITKNNISKFQPNLRKVKAKEKLTIFKNGIIIGFLNIEKIEGEKIFAKLEDNESKKEYSLSRNKIVLDQEKKEREIKNKIRGLGDIIDISKNEYKNIEILFKTKKSHKKLFEKQTISLLIKNSNFKNQDLI